MTYFRRIFDFFLLGLAGAARLALGVVADGARVVDDHVGRARLRRPRHAHAVQLPRHPLAAGAS